jgi:pyridoxine 4-dehydrogenase
MQPTDDSRTLEHPADPRRHRWLVRAQLMTGITAAPAGEILIGDMPVCRIGLGTMQLTGPGAWGEPDDPGAAIALLRRAYDLGVNFIDTADSYGPAITEDLIREALHPYPADLAVATKGGFARPGPGQWTPLGHPAYLRQQAELSLRHLRVDCLDLYQLHRVDPAVPLEDQLGALADLQAEGKVRHIGLSEITVQVIRQASALTPIVSVQNRFSLLHREHDDVVDYAASAGIAFIAWSPLAGGRIPQHPSVRQLAARYHSTPAQAALAWLLHRSPAIVAIPGTRNPAHLAENLSAALHPIAGAAC